MFRGRDSVQVRAEKVLFEVALRQMTQPPTQSFDPPGGLFLRKEVAEV
jgi:hypothetical protein